MSTLFTINAVTKLFCSFPFVLRTNSNNLTLNDSEWGLGTWLSRFKHNASKTPSVKNHVNPRIDTRIGARKQFPNQNMLISLAKNLAGKSSKVIDKTAGIEGETQHQRDHDEDGDLHSAGFEIRWAPTRLDFRVFPLPYEANDFPVCKNNNGGRNEDYHNGKEKQVHSDAQMVFSAFIAKSVVASQCCDSIEGESFSCVNK